MNPVFISSEDSNRYMGPGCPRACWRPQARVTVRRPWTPTGDPGDPGKQGQDSDSVTDTASCDLESREEQTAQGFRGHCQLCVCVCVI